jgi:hypothetical protein
MPRSGSVGNGDDAHPVGNHSNALNAACPVAPAGAKVPPMIYLDHNATTPVLPEVFEAMRPYFCEEWGNPSSAYKFGSKLKGVIETARAQVAELIGALPREVVFTSPATESDNAPNWRGAWGHFGQAAGSRKRAVGAGDFFVEGVKALPPENIVQVVGKSHFEPTGLRC